MYCYITTNRANILLFRASALEKREIYAPGLTFLLHFLFFFSPLLSFTVKEYSLFTVLGHKMYKEKAIRQRKIPIHCWGEKIRRAPIQISIFLLALKINNTLRFYFKTSPYIQKHFYWKSGVRISSACVSVRMEQRGTK